MFGDGRFYVSSAGEKTKVNKLITNIFVTLIILYII